MATKGVATASLQARMAWAVPHGFFRPGGTRKPGGTWSERLEDIGRVDRPLDAAPDPLPEGLLDVGADDEDDAVEAGPEGVEHGVIQDDLAARADRVDLLQSAVAAADPGRHHHQGQRRHRASSFSGSTQYHI